MWTNGVEMQSSYSLCIQQRDHTINSSRHKSTCTTTCPLRERGLVESDWPVGNEGAATLLHTVGERETETWGK